MKFKTSTGEDLQIVLLSGHSIVIGPEFGEDVPPIFVNECLAKGCIADRSIAEPNDAKVEAGQDAMNQNATPEAEYRKAFIAMLERTGTPEGESDFTADGTPNTNSVSKLVGFRANKEDLLHEWHKMQEEAKAEAANDSSDAAAADAASTGAQE